MKLSLFVGLDMVDGTKQPPRKVDLAFLDQSLVCKFGTWDFDPQGRGLDQLKASEYILAIDGPQGLAGSPDKRMRECEREGGTPGKSPYEFPSLDRWGAGYVISSIKLFAALFQSRAFELHGLTSADQATLIEVYPGKGWRRLAKSSGANPKELVRKTRQEGREQRLRLLKQNGIRPVSDRLPTHDQLDAALAAFAALRFAGGTHMQEGVPPFWDIAKQVLREGFIVYP